MDGVREAQPAEATSSRAPETPEGAVAAAQLQIGQVGRPRERTEVVVDAGRGRLQTLGLAGIQPPSERGSLGGRGQPPAAVRELLVDVDDRADQRQLGAEQPVGALGLAQATRPH